MTTVLVCQGATCSPQGSPLLLRDIEEFCGFAGAAEPTSCLNHCGKGPNIQILNGSKKKIVTGVKSFQKMEQVLQENVADLDRNSLKKKVARLKFEVRREEKPGPRIEKLEEAIELLGGLERASKKDQILTSQLLVLRSQERTGREKQALEDALTSARFTPAWSQSHLAVASAWVAQGYLLDGITAMEAAVQNSLSPFEKRTIQKALRELQEEAKEKGLDGAPREQEGQLSLNKVRNETTEMAAWGEEGLTKADPEASDLYKRIGGEQPLVTLVYGVYDMMRADMELGPFFERFAKTPETLTRLKIRTVDYLRGIWGGEQYQGPNLFEAHASMIISADLYDGMVKMYKRMLVKMGVEDTVVVKDIMASLDKMRGPIVDGPDRNVMLKEMEKRLEKATRERKARMVAFKKKQQEERDALLKKAASSSGESTKASSSSGEKDVDPQKHKKQAALARKKIATSPAQRERKASLPITVFEFNPDLDEPPVQPCDSFNSLNREVFYRAVTM